jgi:hypothetical protein
MPIFSSVRRTGKADCSTNCQVFCPLKSATLLDGPVQVPVRGGRGAAGRSLARRGARAPTPPADVSAAGRGTGEQAPRFQAEGVDNRERFHMPLLPKENSPVTLRDVWLFTATSVAIIFIMMITAGLLGQAFF